MSPITLAPCPKAFSRDLDKAAIPAETLTRVRGRLKELDLRIVSETRRVDSGRLGIPVFLSMAGPDALRVMPVRKQMGKGASMEQAEASALMEMVERFSFFTFWQRCPEMQECTFSEARARFGAECIDIEEMLSSVNEQLDPAAAVQALDLVRWKFFPATDIGRGTIRWLPLDWFRLLGEFNGSSAGNTEEESILQGACELFERHVCCVIDRNRPVTPTIDLDAVADPVLADLIGKFLAQGIVLVLKDFSLDQPVPTVGALAWDPASFPGRSEIVFTAGAASSPAKAAIRAVTEVAQLAGDFASSACYEASGLPKLRSPRESDWLTAGSPARLSDLPSIEAPDIYEELMHLTQGLARQGRTLFCVRTTHPALNIPAHYSVIPGFAFRERDKNASIGLFVGRRLCESGEDPAVGLAILERIYPSAHFTPFFRGMTALNAGRTEEAALLFAQAEPLQPEAEAVGLTAFYHAYALTRLARWSEALAPLDRAIAACPEMKEYFNLRGVARFKRAEYAEAARNFTEALMLDKGSAGDLANLGICHKRMGNAEQAAHCLSEALALDPGLDYVRAELEGLEGTEKNE